MRRTLLAIAVTAVLSTTSAFAVELESEEQKLSYSFGLMIANQMKPDFEKLDIEVFNAAVNDVYTGAKPQLTEEEIEASLKKFQDAQLEKQKVLAAKAAEEARVEAEKLAKVNSEIGAKFLAENAKRPEVKTTESGLQIEILSQGEGEMPTAADTVVVHYKGTSIQGDEFDSSYKRDKPATFALNGVIPGWTEGLQHLKAGGKAKLYIPSDLAYGERGAGASIGPSETLIFDVELIEIIKAESEPAEMEKQAAAKK